MKNWKKGPESEKEKTNELDEIIKSYYSKKTIDKNDELYYISTTNSIYSWFTIRAEKIIDKSKLIEIQNKMGELSLPANMEKEKKRFMELMDEYKNILEEAENDFNFYYDLFCDLSGQLKDKAGEVSDIQDIYSKLCNDIIDSRFKTYITYEKKLINLKDNFKKIIDMFN